MTNQSEQFGLIYDQYIEKIYRFVYIKVSSQEVAEDITSRVFMKGFESYQKSQTIENMGAFLYQIARNSVIDHYRQKDRTKTISPDAVPEIKDNGPDVHQRAVFNADMDRVKLAMQDLQKD